MKARSFTSGSEGQTMSLAAALARACVVGDCLLLHGDLGAGKTAFARGFIGALLAEPVDITSPTFTLVQTYPLPGGSMIWHYDLYRLKGAEELEEIALDEALQTGITLIEWPELARAHVPSDALNITLRAGGDPHTRIIDMIGAGAWDERLDTLQGITV